MMAIFSRLTGTEIKPSAFSSAVRARPSAARSASPAAKLSKALPES